MAFKYSQPDIPDIQIFFFHFSSSSYNDDKIKYSGHSNIKYKEQRGNTMPTDIKHVEGHYFNTVKIILKNVIKL